jgi:AmmeMemoRadiSam system protein A
LRDEREIRVPPESARALLEMARSSVEYGLRRGGPLPVDAATLAEPLRRRAASFVTLRRGDGDLRGCVGELEPQGALAESVARNAWNAAFRDPRFEPVAPDELDDLAFHVSVLGPLEPLAFRTEAELLAVLRPGADGVLIDDGLRRATFLPAVWSSLPDARQFLLALKRKAGLPEHDWPPTLRAWRYAAVEIPEPG